MRKCWDEADERDCRTCRAHYRKKGGKCCFGIRFEDDDEICMECPHIEDCHRLTHAYLSRQKNSGAPTRSLSSVKSRILKKKKEKEIEEERLTAPDEDPEERDDEEDRTLTLEHTIQRGIHGAVEGGLELVLGTFRWRRPPP
jgi:hypothetical protein